MNERKYVPAPKDVSDVELPEELKALTEVLAKNTHDVWAQTRIAQGWRFGESRNDAKKIHPCLVPYEALPEEEKVFDRNTARETVKLILSLGFKIEKR